MCPGCSPPLSRVVWLSVCVSPSPASLIHLSTHQTSCTATKSSYTHCTKTAEEGPFLSWSLVWELRGDGHGPVVACGVDERPTGGKQGITVSGHCCCRWFGLVVCRNQYTLDTVRGTPERDSNEFLGRLVAFHPSIGPSHCVPGSLGI